MKKVLNILRLSVIVTIQRKTSAAKSMFEILILIITLLANRLNLNSTNSSKPPSSDPNRKISGCFRSMDGAKIFCRIRGYLSNCRKQGVKSSHALDLLFNGKLPDFACDRKNKCNFR